MGKERRREPRYPYRLPITLKAQGKAQETITEDVSYRGVFVATDEPPPLRSLIQLKVQLPDSSEVFETHAMSVFVLERGNAGGRTPGAGLQFYALNGPRAATWNRFIDSVRRKANPPVPKSPPRKHVRLAIKLAVRPRTMGELETLFTHNVSRGGMFLKAPKPIELGTELALDVIHPETEDVFTLDCVIRRVELGPPIGLGVEFHKLSEEQRNAFWEFIHSAIEELTDEDLLLVDDEDPKLA